MTTLDYATEAAALMGFSVFQIDHHATMRNFFAKVMLEDSCIKAIRRLAALCG